MPELPEVETIVRDLAPRLIGRSLRNPTLFKTDVLRGVSSNRLLATLRGNRIREVTRRAKHIVILLETGERMVIQLRMTGNLIFYDRRLRREEREYIVFRAATGDGSTLVYRDVRRLGTIWLLKEGPWRTYTGRIGPEPLAPDFTAEELHAALRPTRQAIKKAIMDQRRVAGVGNIYANEALFRSGIDPSRPACSLQSEETRRLHTAMRTILLQAIEAGGTTLRDYRTGTGDEGSFQRVLDVYGRDGEPCDRCGTRLHTTHVIDGRATTFCWRCQGRG